MEDGVSAGRAWESTPSETAGRLTVGHVQTCCDACGVCAKTRRTRHGWSVTYPHSRRFAPDGHARRCIHQAANGTLATPPAYDTHASMSTALPPDT